MAIHMPVIRGYNITLPTVDARVRCRRLQGSRDVLDDLLSIDCGFKRCYVEGLRSIGLRLRVHEGLG
jgi:hypothetical protein